MKTYNHRGMLLEKIINNTINYYLKNKIAFFNKKNLNIKFKTISEDRYKLDLAFISSKSTVDYYGVYQGQYISFEAKSTELDVFPLSNIKEHQHQHLKLINELGGWTFYLIFFKKYNRIFLIDIDKIENNHHNKKSISLKEMELISNEIEITFPGIIDFLSFIPF